MKESKSYNSYIKSPYRSIKHSTYFDVYDKIFLPYVGKKITFVEIGILDGGSLFMWKDFFGPQSRIVGIDYNPKALQWKEAGFEIYIGSQSDPSFWDDFFEKVGNIDIILDDGGHTYEQQIITTEKVLPKINESGLIVIEDTHTSYKKNFGPKCYSLLEYTKLMIDKINLRFSELNYNNAEYRVWSIRIFESIIVFEINNKALKIKSEPTDNGRKSLNNIDYRYADKPIVNALKNPNNRIKKIIYFPLIKPFFKLFKKIVIIIYNIKIFLKLRVYFR